MPSKKDIISILGKIADLMEYGGENPFKVNAFKNGANSLKQTGDEFELMVKEKTLDKIKGIGKGIQSVIYEYYERGESSLYNDLKKTAPEGIEDLLKIRGLGTKKIKLLHEELGISNIGELEYACSENRIALLKGFGKATQEKILLQIKKLKEYGKYILLDKAEEYADDIVSQISKYTSVAKVAVSGELRRGMEIISCIQFILLVRDISVFNAEKKIFGGKGNDGKKNILASEYPVHLSFHIVSSEKEFTKMLFITTGSEEFINNIQFDISGSYRSEQEIFTSNHAPFVIPEMREKEYLQVANEELKKNSGISIDKFHGLLHFHTTYSDGRNSLKEMIVNAKAKGFDYAAVCDHSTSAFYANGLTEKRIYQQKEEIKAISSELNYRVFHGIESDILSDGSLDFRNEFLPEFDFIVASVHSIFTMEQEVMTRRIIKAIENPYTDLLGHPSGRLLLMRDPYKFDQKKVIDACASNNVAIEINANPQRLDLDWRWIYYAREKGCLFSINPDAHSIDQIDFIKYGILTGRKGGLREDEVINCFKQEKFEKYLSRKFPERLKRS